MILLWTQHLTGTLMGRGLRSRPLLLPCCYHHHHRTEACGCSTAMPMLFQLHSSKLMNSKLITRH